MIVVADTSPLNYLILIGEVDILPSLFGGVVISCAVLNELLDPLSPDKVREWLKRPPTWLEVWEVKGETDESLDELGAGEREAIQLALNAGIMRVLMDESKGRAIARGLALEVEGTLGILERAAGLGLVDFRLALGKLERTNFRLAAPIRAAFLSRNQ